MQDSLKKADQSKPVSTVAVEPVEATTSEKDTRPLSQRIRFSFSSSFWMNTSNFYFELSPMLTYYFPEIYSVGAGPTYVLNKDRKNDISLHGWGGKVYARADLTTWLYGWTEYQGISNQFITGIDPVTKQITRDHEYVGSWFLSMGLNIPLGRSGINVQALYDVLYKKSNSYTYSPVTYRIGFGF